MADVHHPHDRLFRLVFSDASEAAGLLQGALPDTLSNSFDWTSLTLQDGTFIDTDLRQSQSDLLYRIRYVATGEPVSMYVLLEHQSSPDPWLRLRLLRYCCRIWEAERRGEPERLALRPSCRWCSTRASGPGIIRPSSPICFPRVCGGCRGCRDSPMRCWIRRPWRPGRCLAASRGVWCSC